MEGLTPKEADAWASEMTRIVGGTIHELIAAADKHNIDRDSDVQYYSDLFSAMASVATFEHYEWTVGPMARDEVWDALKNHAKQVHSERVAKNPDRIAYAIQQFEAHGIEYQGTIPHCCSRHWHCEPGKAAKDYVPKQEEGEADVR